MQANRKRVRLTGLICLMSLMLVAAITGCVKVVPATGITLDQSTLTVEVGSTARLRATVEPEDVLDSRVYWDTSDASVATVDSRGKVTGIAEGTAVISAETSDARYYAECTVTVIAAGLVWDGDTPSEQPDGFDTPDPDDPEADPNLIVINDTQALAYFAAQVNAGNSYSGKTVRLGRDLDLNNQAWTPIGRSGSAFSGTFDGNGMTLSNLYVENTESEFAGLFGMLNTGTVKNLNVHNASVKGLSSVGVIAGGYTGKIENCHVTGLIQVEGSYKVGGIIGYAYATVTDSSVAGDEGSYVRGTYLEADLEGDNVGGVIGFVGEGSKTYSGLSASISVEGTRKVGGVIGYLSADVSAEGLSYTGSVSTNATGEYLLENASRIMVGGLVGEYAANTSLTNSAVTDSTVTGASAACTGALVGGTRNVNNVLIQSGNTQTNVTVVIRAEIADGFCLVAEGYEISNANGLRYFGKSVNAGTQYQNATVLLAADIDLAGENWTPMNMPAGVAPAVIDGQNHTIRNMTVDGDEIGNRNCGFIGSTTATIEIRNLIFENASLANTGSFAGVVIGYQYGNITLNSVEVINSSVKGRTTTDTVKDIRLGGLIGFSILNDGAKLTLKDCSVTGSEFYGYHNVGGLVGTLYDCWGDVNESYGSNGAYVPKDAWSMTGCSVTDCTFTIDGPNKNYVNAFAVDSAYVKTFDEATAAFAALSNTQTGNTFVYTRNILVVAANTYEIQNKAGFEEFRDAVNAGTSYQGKTVLLACDIDLNNEEWTPIGKSGATFKGTFDGNGKTISNLKISGTTDNTAANNYRGLFGTTESPATVKNFTIYNAEVSGSLYVAAAVGMPYTGQVSDITVTGLVKISAWWYTGVIGGNGYASVKNCTVDVTEGSIVSATGSYVGGIFGFHGEGAIEISDCSSNIDVTGFSYVGGIAGICHYGNTISNCSAVCTVTKTASVADSDQSDLYGIGGIAGITVDGAQCRIADCSFKGQLVSALTGEKAFPHDGIVGCNKGGSVNQTNLVIENCTAEFTLNDGFTYSSTTKVYSISNVNGLNYFRDSVNAGNRYSGKTVVLTADLDLEGESWTPIGDSVASYPSVAFAGTFDGQEHTISNLTTAAERATNPDTNAADGLFGTLVGKVRNLTLKNVVITGTHYVGAIAGYSSTNVGMAIENCHVDGAELTSVPVMIGDSYDNGDKVGGIIGYCVSGDQIIGCTVTNTVIKGYRDLGGISGCAAATVTNCSVANVQITADQATNSYGAKDVNAGDLIGRDTGAVQSGNTAENVSYTFIGCVNNKTIALNAETATVIKDVSASAVGISVSGAGELILENVTVAASAEGVSGLALEADSNVKVTVVGSVSLTGAKNGEGIRVPGSAVIEITGAGSLTAVGNAGKEYSSATGYQTEDTEYESSGASGIGYAGQAVGKIYIHDLAGLTAEGYGVHAFGIGGNITSDLSLENVTSVASVRGGFAQALCLADEKYGKSEPEGGAAIGVGTDATAFGISLKNVAVVSAKGGSKAAGIGAQHHTKAVISITGCTIESVTGGNASAGIGGSRIAENTGSDRSGQTISITIADSTINSQGGQFGAGIGSGYDTYCTQGDLAAICTITITGDSKIAAKGGKYAAGIGTGYHASGLTGTIDATVDTTGTASGEDFYKATYTSAQAIGFGIVDPTRDGLNSTSSITVGDTVISIADAIAAISAA